MPTASEPPITDREAVFNARGVTKVYHMGEVDVHALRGVDLDLFAGEFVVLLGPSGSGKSTLLNILGGLDSATSGVVSYHGRDLTKVGDTELTRYRREHVGFVFQFYNLIPSLTARENVALVTEIATEPMRPDEALKLVGLEDRMDHFPSQLSGGQQQRVAIARAVAKRPYILLCDEPTGTLDVQTGIVVLEAIDRVNRELGTTTVVITHNTAIAAMADRVITLFDGKVSGVRTNTSARRRAAWNGDAVIRAIDRKLLRDLWTVKGQAAAITIVIICGVAAFVMTRSALSSLEGTRAAYYDRHRFADVFARVKRAPQSLVSRINEIPGVNSVTTRVVEDVILDVPGIAEPAVGRLISLPEREDTSDLNLVYLRLGRLPEADRDNEALVGEAFAVANNIGPGDTFSAVINGKKKKLLVVGVALSPEYIFQMRAGDFFPDDKRFAILWMARRTLEYAFDLRGSFNDIALTLSPGANEPEVLRQLDDLTAPYGGTGRAWPG